jgi:hypothetical protein
MVVPLAVPEPDPRYLFAVAVNILRAGTGRAFKGGEMIET